MIYTHNTSADPMSHFNEVKDPNACKELGIYEQTKETRQILTEVLFMLNQFKREIWNYNIPEGENAMDPTCFRDEVASINSLAFAIRGDLTRLMDEFH